MLRQSSKWSGGLKAYTDYETFANDVSRCLYWTAVNDNYAESDVVVTVKVAVLPSEAAKSPQVAFDHYVACLRSQLENHDVIGNVEAVEVQVCGRESHFVITKGTKGPISSTQQRSGIKMRDGTRFYPDVPSTSADTTDSQVFFPPESPEVSMADLDAIMNALPSFFVDTVPVRDEFETIVGALQSLDVLSPLQVSIHTAHPANELVNRTALNHALHELKNLVTLNGDSLKELEILLDGPRVHIRFRNGDGVQRSTSKINWDSKKSRLIVQDEIRSFCTYEAFLDAHPDATPLEWCEVESDTDADWHLWLDANDSVDPMPLKRAASRLYTEALSSHGRVDLLVAASFTPAQLNALVRTLNELVPAVASSLEVTATPDGAHYVFNTPKGPVAGFDNKFLLSSTAKNHLFASKLGARRDSSSSVASGYNLTETKPEPIRTSGVIVGDVGATDMASTMVSRQTPDTVKANTRMSGEYYFPPPPAELLNDVRPLGKVDEEAHCADADDDYAELDEDEIGEEYSLPPPPPIKMRQPLDRGSALPAPAREPTNPMNLKPVPSTSSGTDGYSKVNKRGSRYFVLGSAAAAPDSASTTTTNQRSNNRVSRYFAFGPRSFTPIDKPGLESSAVATKETDAGAEASEYAYASSRLHTNQPQKAPASGLRASTAQSVKSGEKRASRYFMVGGTGDLQPLAQDETSQEYQPAENLSGRQNVIRTLERMGRRKKAEQAEPPMSLTSPVAPRVGVKNIGASVPSTYQLTFQADNGAMLYTRPNEATDALTDLLKIFLEFSNRALQEGDGAAHVLLDTSPLRGIAVLSTPDIAVDFTSQYQEAIGNRPAQFLAISLQPHGLVWEAIVDRDTIVVGNLTGANVSWSKIGVQDLKLVPLFQSKNTVDIKPLVDAVMAEMVHRTAFSGVPLRVSSSEQWNELIDLPVFLRRLLNKAVMEINIPKKKSVQVEFQDTAALLKISDDRHTYEVSLDYPQI